METFRSSTGLTFRLLSGFSYRQRCGNGVCQLAAIGIMAIGSIAIGSITIGSVEICIGRNTG